MRRVRFTQSVVTRLVITLVAGGLVVSAGLGVLSLRRAEVLLRMQLTQETALATRSVQGVVRALGPDATADGLQQALQTFIVSDWLRAVRLTRPDAPPVEAGHWPQDQRWGRVWSLAESGLGVGNEVDLAQLTLVEAPFGHAGQRLHLELLVDGPSAARQTRARVLGDLGTQWLFLAVVVLAGLLALRRWFAHPLSEVVELVGSGAAAEPFYRLSGHLSGEFSQLAEAIAGMLTRLDATTQRLRQREQAFENLYQMAPVALISLDRAGRIVEANYRAVVLLGKASERDLLGQLVLPLMRPEDREVLRQTIDRLELDRTTTRCELRVLGESRQADVLVEAVGVRDEEDRLQGVRLALQDISQSKQLQRELANKSQLLNLVIDHMSDAILLVDSQGTVAAHNQQLAMLLHRRAGSLVGQPYDPETFWDELGVLNSQPFIDRLRQIETQQVRSAQERFETRVGTFLFQGIPVHDAAGQSVGRLWVVQEITPQEQNQRLLAMQTAQLQALRRLGSQLRDVDNLDQLLLRAVEHLHEIFGVEAMGLVLRRDRAGGRGRQLIHRGLAPYRLAPNRALAQAIERHLMPPILSNHEATFWPDLPAGQPWATVFEQAGLTCVAGVPLRGSSDAHGILWIARRGGERLERHHIYLLEALAPLIAARLEIAKARQRMHELELTDPVTELPSREQFQALARRLANRPGYPWAVLALNLDHFGQLNQHLSHEVVDGLLRQVAKAMRASCRASNVVARLGGNTFGVLVPETSPDQAVALAQRLREVIAAQSATLPDGTVRPFTASVGLACCPEDSPSAETLMHLAQDRLALAKRLGRDRVVSEGTTKRAG